MGLTTPSRRPEVAFEPLCDFGAAYANWQTPLKCSCEGLSTCHPERQFGSTETLNCGSWVIVARLPWGQPLDLSDLVSVEPQRAFSDADCTLGVVDYVHLEASPIEARLPRAHVHVDVGGLLEVEQTYAGPEDGEAERRDRSDAFQP